MERLSEISQRWIYFSAMPSSLGEISGMDELFLTGVGGLLSINYGTTDEKSKDTVFLFIEQLSISIET